MSISGEYGIGLYGEGPYGGVAPDGSCLWPADPACFTEDWAALSEEVRGRSLALASMTLTRLTGGRVSECPITVRPRSGHECGFTVSGTPFHPSNWSGTWTNNHTGFGLEVTLPPPVGRIDEVKIDGVVLATNKYRLVNGRHLLFSPEIVLPIWQDLFLADTEPGTMSVTYLNAYPVTQIGAVAAGLLAMEFAKACIGSGKCRLPREVTSIVRQGITMEIAAGSFPNGLTGIREVDSYIASWNPNALSYAPTVWSPDQARVFW